MSENLRYTCTFLCMHSYFVQKQPHLKFCLFATTQEVIALPKKEKKGCTPLHIMRHNLSLIFNKNQCLTYPFYTKFPFLSSSKEINVILLS